MGDKTLLDVLVPLADCLEREFAAGAGGEQALRAAATVAARCPAVPGDRGSSGGEPLRAARPAEILAVGGSKHRGPVGPPLPARHAIPEYDPVPRARRGAAGLASPAGPDGL